MVANPRDHALSFEAVKVAMRQTKDGYAMTLVIHPDEVPPDLFAAPVGQRYVVALVGVDVDETPLPVSERKKPVDTPEVQAVQYAGMLCREPKFWEWLRTLHYDAYDADGAAKSLRQMLYVRSRREIGEDPEVLKNFNKTTEAYRAWAGMEG